MLRATAFALLFLGAISKPLALLCDFECSMMGAEASPQAPAQSLVQPDGRQCCEEAPLIKNQWAGKPQPKVLRVGNLQPAPQELLALHFPYSTGCSTSAQSRKLPSVESCPQVLRI